ncbi:ABC transporter substrate-binding protein [Pseudoroseicyclus aestuarii]|uniref:ABC transporter substrate-binding protein n=1 Tax=Pseudoroseicyclus aestuarii TaxID=1795041 RepID=UPI003CCC4890
MTARLGAGVAALALMAGTAGAQSLMFPIDEGDFNWDSYHEFADATDLSGQSLTISGPWLSVDQELFESVLAYFEEATGADVSYVGSDSFEQQIVIDVEAGSAPNIGVFPQPGLLNTLANRGLVTPMPEGTEEWIAENYAAGQSWVDLATFEGPEGEEDLYGLFYKADVKSLVWYIPENFEDAGYEIPETMEDLKALTEQIVEDGETPWCIGLGSGGATGWPATDWVEDMVLRTQPPEVYDQWVSHEIPFNDERIVNAISEFGYFLQDDFVAGGSQAVASTDFRDSPQGLFSFPPQCYMHHMASFIPSFFPEGTVVGEDADFFYFPAYEEEDLGQPVLGAGTVFAITDENEAANAFMQFLQTPIAHEIWMAQSGFLTPLTTVNTDLFGDPTLGRMNEILLDATTFRFDGSDLMPGAIGAGAFWTGMVDFAGGASAQEAADEIEDAWAAIDQ